MLSETPHNSLKSVLESLLSDQPATIYAILDLVNQLGVEKASSISTRLLAELTDVEVDQAELTVEEKIALAAWLFRILSRIAHEETSIITSPSSLEKDSVVPVITDVEMLANQYYLTGATARLRACNALQHGLRIRDLGELAGFTQQDILKSLSANHTYRNEVKILLRHIKAMVHERGIYFIGEPRSAEV